MADDMMTDEERAEALKRWFQENGAVLAAGVVIGLGGLFGWQFWTGYQETQLETAAAKYQSVTGAVERSDADRVSAIAEELREQHAASPYDTQALFALAKLHVEAGDLSAAAAALREALAIEKQPGIVEVGRNRLARVLISDDRAQEALSLLEGNAPSPAFAALHYELYGDALRDLGRTEEARTAYNDALGALTEQTAQALRGSLELKIASLGPAPDGMDDAGDGVPMGSDAGETPAPADAQS